MCDLSRLPGRPSSEGQISVTLINSSENPREAIYCTWMRSRDRTFKMSTREVKERAQQDPEFAEEVEALFLRLLTDDLPLCEVVYFNFWIDDLPISLREQLVRHRIGMKPDATGKVGVDQVPDLSDSTWWSQTMRVMDMGKFVDEGRYMVPNTVLSNPRAEEIYTRAMQFIQAGYNALVEQGIPVEDARQVIPMGATHGMSWSLNLQALKHVIGKRSCWIAQSGMWHPLINGMLHELCEKVDPAFRLLATPPCIRGEKFVGCAFHEENIRRIDGRDHMHPPCSLYLANHSTEAEAAVVNKADEVFPRHWMPSYDPASGEPVSFLAPTPNAEIQYKEREATYKEFWNRDTQTGQLLS